MEIGSLVAMWRYPVKSLRGEALTEVDVRSDGLAGDRSRALFVESGHVRAGKAYRGKEHNELHLLDDPQAALSVAAQRNVRLRIDHQKERYFDDAPVSILVDRWLEGVSAHVGFPVEPLRFRPNFFVHAVSGFNEEESTFTGRELQLGDVRLRVRYPIARCVTTTYDPQTGAGTPEVLRYVAQYRSTWMGVYCDVLRAGTARIRDSLSFVDR